MACAHAAAHNPAGRVRCGLAVPVGTADARLLFLGMGLMANDMPETAATAQQYKTCNSMHFLARMVLSGNG